MRIQNIEPGDESSEKKGGEGDERIEGDAGLASAPPEQYTRLLQISLFHAERDGKKGGYLLGTNIHLWSFIQEYLISALSL